MVELRKKNKLNSVDLSSNYDQIDKSLLDKWQGIIDIASRMYKVPTALITRLHNESIEVLVKNENIGNPYKKNEKTQLGMGIYCETVIDENRALEIPNALHNQLWKDNPAVLVNMISYFGLPILWPNGKVFGTICISDNKTRHYNDTDKKLLYAFKGTIEKDLNLLNQQMLLSKNINEIKKTQELIVNFEKNKLTNQLVSSISHEISTPIGVALTTASYMDYVLQKSPDSLEKLREGANLVQKNLEQASKMLMTFKQITEDKEMEKQKEVHLRTFVNSVIRSLKYDLKKHHVDISIEINDQISVKVHAHALVQILLNLTINATLHAFKDDREKKILIKGESVSNGIELLVSDNGVGMTEKSCERAFEPFVRYDTETEGSGLGLTIVKDLVERVLNGTIECFSNNKGTTFKMYLPLEVNYEAN